MDMLEWTKGFFFKICKKIEDHLAKIIAGGIIAVASVMCVVFSKWMVVIWEWLKTKHSLEVYGWLWIIVSFILLFLVVFFFRSMLKDRGRLKNPLDIVNTIDAWLAGGDRQMYPVDLGTPHSFRTVEKELYLKQGSSLKYLPMCALRYGYAFEMGHKTFTLKKLTRDNDPSEIIHKHLESCKTKDKEEFMVPCDIDDRLGWPKGAFKSFLLIRPPVVNEKYGYEAHDAGRDKVRIKQKN